MAERNERGQFVPGNTVSKKGGRPAKHGADSAREVAKNKQLTRDKFYATLVEIMPPGWFETADKLLIDQLHTAATQLRLYEEYLEAANGGSLVKSDGKNAIDVRGYNEVRSFYLKLSETLGITPKSRAEIIKNLSNATQNARRSAARSAARLRAGVLAGMREDQLNSLSDGELLALPTTPAWSKQEFQETE